MRRRVESLGGTFHLGRQPSGGTHLSASMPLTPNRATHPPKIRPNASRVRRSASVYRDRVPAGWIILNQDRVPGVQHLTDRGLVEGLAEPVEQAAEHAGSAT